MKFPMTRAALLLLIVSLLYLGGLGLNSLWDVDETRNAEAAVEMMARGDMVVPTVNGEVRAHKPPLHYWFMIFAYKMFGVSAFSARFFQAVFGIVTVFLVVLAGSAALGTSAGLLSGLILAVSFLFVVSARSATTDSFLVFFTNAAVFAGYYASKRRIWAVAAWAAMGFAVLSKGPVGVVLPLGALILMRLMDRKGGQRLKGLRELFPPEGLVLFAAIAAPWYFLAADRTGGDLITTFLLKHNVGRYLNPMESHGGPVFYYLLLLPALFYPWAVFLPQALVRGLGSREPRDGISGFLRLQVIWAAVVILFFSLAGTKLPNYILPSFPALSLLIGSWIGSLANAPGSGFRGRSVSWLFNLIPSLLFLVLFFVLFRLRAPGYLDLTWLALPLAAAGFVGLLFHWKRKGDPSAAFIAAACTCALGTLCLYLFLVPRLEPLRMAPRLGRAIAQASEKGDMVASLGYNRPALYFYGKRHVVRVREGDSLREFLSLPGGRFVVTTGERFEKLGPGIKNRLKILEKGLDALDTNEVVVLAERVGSSVQSPQSKE